MSPVQSTSETQGVRTWITGFTETVVVALVHATNSIPFGHWTPSTDRF